MTAIPTAVDGPRRRQKVARLVPVTDPRGVAGKQGVVWGATRSGGPQRGLTQWP